MWTSVLMTMEAVTRTASTNLGPTCVGVQEATSWGITITNVLTPMSVSVTTVTARVKITVSTWTDPTTARATVSRAASWPVTDTRVRSRTCVPETRQDALTAATVPRVAPTARVPRVCSWGMIGRRVRTWTSAGWGHRVRDDVSTLLAPTRVSWTTVRRTRSGGTETVILCVDMESCIKMVGVFYSVGKDKKNATENA